MPSAEIISRRASIELARALASSYGLGGDCFMAAEMVANAGTPVRIIALPALIGEEGSAARADTGRRLRPADLGGVADENDLLFCHAAHSLLTTMVEAAFPAPAVSEPHEVDRGPRGTRNAWSGAAHIAARWEGALEDMDSLDRTLVNVIEATPSSDPDKDYLTGWSGRVLALERPGTELVPMDLRGAKDPLQHRHISMLPFSARFEATPTTRIPQPAPQAPTAFSPRALGDILEREAVGAIEDWLAVSSPISKRPATPGLGRRRVRDSNREACGCRSLGPASSTTGRWSWVRASSWRRYGASCRTLASGPPGRRRCPPTTSRRPIGI